jgi:GTP-binding protein
MDQTDPLQNYKQIREELRLYDEQLAERPELLFVSKSELPDAQALADLLHEETGKTVGLLSAATGQGLTELIRQLTAILKEAQQDEDARTPPAQPAPSESSAP